MASRQGRTSIHTPLQPASVQDLKAKFDSGKVDAAVSLSQKKGADSAAASLSKNPPPSSTSSSSSLSSSTSSTGVTLSGLSSSLQAAANRKIGSSAGQAPSATSLSTSAKSSIALTTARPFQPVSTSSKLGSAPGSGRNSPTLGKLNSAAASSSTSSSSTSSSLSSTSSNSSSSTSRLARADRKLEPKTGTKIGAIASKTDISIGIDRDKEGRLEIPVMHISDSGSEVTVESNVVKRKVGQKSSSGLGSGTRSDVSGSRYLGKKVSETKELFNKEPSTTAGSSPRTKKTVATKVDSGSKSSTPSPPVQRTNRLVAREIKIERLDSGANITTYKDGGGIAGGKATKTKVTSSTDSSQPKTQNDGECGGDGSAKNFVELKVHHVTNSGRSSPASTSSSSSSSSRPNSQQQQKKPEDAVPEFRQVKLRKSRPLDDKDNSAPAKGGLTVNDFDDAANKRLSRRMSAERFERLMFDFQRGVPTEADAESARRGSETDHILLQEKVRALTTRPTTGSGRRRGETKAEKAETPEDDEDVPIINKKKKEESIFKEGLKVSDFVKQVNKLNPDAESAPPPKWKVQRAQRQASSSEVSTEDGYYQGIPGEEYLDDDRKWNGGSASEEDDIYEKVAAHRAPSSVSTDGEQEPADSNKAPGRRLGVYSQMVNLKNLAFKKLKVKGGKKKAGKSTKTDTVSDSEEVVVYSDGEGGWEQRDRDSDGNNTDSTGTEYEDVLGPDLGDFDGEEVDCGDSVYEDLESLRSSSSVGGTDGKGAGGGAKGKKITSKLKNIFTNKKSKGGKKRKPAADSGVSAGTDSEGEQLDGDETLLQPIGDAAAVDSDTISRTSSERSSGRFVRSKEDGSITSVTATSTTSSLAITTTSATTTTTAGASLGGEGGSSSLSVTATTTTTTTTTAAASSTTTTSAVSTTSTAASTSAVTNPAAKSTTKSAASGTIMSSSDMPPPPPPPLPPRTTKNLSSHSEDSPPLPPRNPSLPAKSSNLAVKTSTLGVSLDTVVPVSPPGRSSTGSRIDKKKDRFSFGNSSQDGSDNSLSKLDYIDYDPASAQTLERERERRSNVNSRPVSSSSVSSGSGSSSNYMYPDLSAFPQLKGDNSDDNLYVDLLTLMKLNNEDEHIYGKASDLYVSRFESEPLYQMYNKSKIIQNTCSDKSTSDDLSDEEYLELEEREKHESVYEDVLEKKTGSPKSSAQLEQQEVEDVSANTRDSLNIRDKPQRRSMIEDVFKNGGNLHRALWCQMPEVISSGLLEKLSDHDKKIQEAMFEIMTSEASYQRSLKVLISVFLMAPEFKADMSDRCVITRRDRQVLFSNIGHIKDISEDFLRDLEQRWQESCYMKDVCDIIHKHASANFEPYVRYCGNQAYQDRALNTLKQNTEFSEAVKRLEQNSQCQFLPLSSFLLLPMQRITRLPLLVDAICHRLEPGTALHGSAKRALDSLTKVAKKCDEAAKKMQQAEQMCLLAQNLEFKVKEFPLVSASRFLIKQGELNMIKADGTNRKPLSKLLGSHKEHVYLYLFNDVLLVAKKKGSTFQVRDYCQRNSLFVEAVDNPDKSRHLTPGVATGVPNLLFLALLANHENKQVELVLSCKSESERTRWVDAISPTPTAGDNERIYDYWDCPQFHCVVKYIAQQPDELTLEEGDVINVTRKMKDGWCEGERIRDGEKGWFPSSHTEEINNSHVRARNLRIRYRLIMAFQGYNASH